MPTRPAPAWRARATAIAVKTIQAVVNGIGVPLGIFGWAKNFMTQAAHADMAWGYRLLPLLLPGLAFFGVVAVHEAGHWLGSRRAGLHCFAVRVGWLHLERRGAGWRWRVGARVPGTWGLVWAVPLHFRALRRRQRLFVAAGPAASLLVGAAALGLGWGLRTWVAPSPAFGAWGFAAAEFLVLAGGWSVLLGLLNLLPFNSAGGYASDGAHLYLLSRPNPEAMQQRALLRLTTASHLGQRPRHWDAAVLARLLTTSSQSATYCTAHLFAYAHYLDAANLPAARQHLRTAVEARQLAGPLMRRHLYCEAAYMALVHDRQPEHVPLWLEAAARVKPLAGRADAFARAVEACSAERWDQARRLLQRAAQEAEKTLDLGGQAQERDRIRELAQLIEQGSQPRPEAAPATARPCAAGS